MLCIQSTSCARVKAAIPLHPARRTEQPDPSSFHRSTVLEPPLVILRRKLDHPRTIAPSPRHCLRRHTHRPAPASQRQAQIGTTVFSAVCTASRTESQAPSNADSRPGTVTEKPPCMMPVYDVRLGREPRQRAALSTYAARVSIKNQLRLMHRFDHVRQPRSLPARPPSPSPPPAAGRRPRDRRVCQVGFTPKSVL